ncbi:MAG: hypothetical protein ABH845_05465 [Candidatus Omnitrophota bacterium]
MRVTMKGLVLLLAVLLAWSGIAAAEVIRGKVKAIDLTANRVTMEYENADRSFTFDPQDFIVWQGDDEVKPEVIKPGIEAEVGYYKDETGLEIASWVDLTPAEEETMTPPADVLLPDTTGGDSD